MSLCMRISSSLYGCCTSRVTQNRCWSWPAATSHRRASRRDLHELVVVNLRDRSRSRTPLSFPSPSVRPLQLRQDLVRCLDLHPQVGNLIFGVSQRARIAVAQSFEQVLVARAVFPSCRRSRFPFGLGLAQMRGPGRLTGRTDPALRAFDVFFAGLRLRVVSRLGWFPRPRVDVVAPRRPPQFRG
jgi:hypothetical protein